MVPTNDRGTCRRRTLDAGPMSDELTDYEQEISKVQSAIDLAKLTVVKQVFADMDDTSKWGLLMSAVENLNQYKKALKFCALVAEGSIEQTGSDIGFNSILLAAQLGRLPTKKEIGDLDD
jgi:hypothetical protein